MMILCLPVHKKLKDCFNAHVVEIKKVVEDIIRELWRIRTYLREL